MRLVVYSHKNCWPDPSTPSGHATDGGFAKQMDALSELFDHTTVCVPVASEPPPGAAATQSPFLSERLSISPLPVLAGSGRARRLRIPLWLARVMPRLIREVRRADAVHAPIPGDIGTFGIVLAEAFRRPLLVRYCGNWLVSRTRAENVWHRYMSRRAGGRRIMLATGGGDEPPDPDHPDVQWVFSASLRSHELPDPDPAHRPPIDEGVQLVTVGRQEPYKGTREIIEALPLLVERHPGLSLHVVGDGSGLAAFEQRAAELGVSDAVIFHGAQRHDRVLTLVSAAHVFVFPTKSEGFPKAVAEALACGVPVVTSPVSVLTTLISDSVGALLADSEPESIADAVDLVLADHAARSHAAGALGAQFTLDRWRDEIGRHLQTAWGPETVRGPNSL